VTAIGLTMSLLAESLTIPNARRATIAKRKRKPVAEYRRTENSRPSTCECHLKMVVVPWNDRSKIL
jgi:hypothetical protein